MSPRCRALLGTLLLLVVAPARGSAQAIVQTPDGVTIAPPPGWEASSPETVALGRALMEHVAETHDSAWHATLVARPPALYAWHESADHPRANVNLQVQHGTPDLPRDTLAALTPAGLATLDASFHAGMAGRLPAGLTLLRWSPVTRVTVHGRPALRVEYLRSGVRTPMRIVSVIVPWSTGWATLTFTGPDVAWTRYAPVVAAMVASVTVPD